MKKNIIIAVVIVLAVGGILFLSNKVEKNINMEKTTKEMISAILHTNKGDIAIEFFEKETPNTVANFIKLAKESFYNGTKFHRVIKAFMIQGGDPLTKD